MDTAEGSAALRRSDSMRGAAHAELIARRRELPGRLSGLSVWQQVRALAVWPFMEQLLNFCVGFVDTAIAGRLSVAATEAIAVGAYVGWLLAMMFGAVGIGAGALVARGVGGSQRRLARAALGQALTATAVLGLSLAILVWLGCPHVCTILNLGGESHQIAVRYLRWIALGTPVMGILLVSSASLRSAGDTRTPFFVLATVNVVNVFASLTFVFAPAPLGGLGTGGIAMGTVVAWSVGVLLILTRLLTPRSAVRLFGHRLWPERRMLARIFRVSGPQFLDSLALWTGNFLLAMMVGWIGRNQQTGALAAHVIVVRLEALSYLPGWAMGQAAATLMGQYLGMLDPDRARQAATYCWMLAAAIMGSMGLLFMAIPHQLVGLVTQERLLLELAPQVLRVCGPVQVFFATVLVLENAIRGAGDTRPVALRVMFSTFMVRLPAAYVAGFVLQSGIRGIWIAMCGELVFRAFLIGGYFVRDRWRHVNV